MKCAPVHLLNRSEYGRRKFNRNITKSTEPVYITKGYHGYSFTFIRNPAPATKSQPMLSVKNINLPENVSKFNTGCSLEKWSNKTPRLRSGSKNITASNSNCSNTTEEDYDINLDLNNILDRLEDIDASDNSDSMPNGEEYEINSDIAELLRKSQETGEREKGKKARDLKDKGRYPIEDKLRKKNRHKLKKTIRFSFSKPASPNTEQVIRVDVTSNISLDELRHIETTGGDLRRDDCSKANVKMINESKNDFDGSLNENSIIKFDEGEEEFLIRCSQLALTQKRR